MSDPHVPISRTDEFDRSDERQSPATRPTDRRANMPAPPGAVQRGTAAPRGAARDEMEPAHPNRAARDVMEPADPQAARDVMETADPDRAVRDVTEPDPWPQAPETD